MNPQQPDQLTLGVSLDDNATFENFLVAARNEQAVATLAGGGRSEQLLLIWGSTGCGLTHLLQAACHREAGRQHGSLYLPMREAAELHPEILQGVNSLSLVCIDDVQHIAGNAQWETALFTAFNAIRDSHTQLILAAHSAPAALPIQLQDLHSRLQSCLVFHISELDDREKLQVLQLRARNRGMELSDSVGEFILQRAERNLAALMNILDQLDRVSLSQQRRLTIPLVKAALGW